MQCHREKKRGHKGELAQRFSETQVLKIEILNILKIDEIYITITTVGTIIAS